MNAFSEGSLGDIMRAMESFYLGQLDDRDVIDTIILAGSELKPFYFDGQGWVGSIFMYGDLYLLKPAEGLLVLIKLVDGFVPLNEIDKDKFPEHRILSFEPSSLAYNCTAKIEGLDSGDGHAGVNYAFIHGDPNNRTVCGVSHLAQLIFASPIE